MKHALIHPLLAACSLIPAGAAVWQPAAWPVLKTYDEAHLYRVALPVGGIGTGTVSLAGRGMWCDWEVMNVPAKGYSTVTPGNNAPFFALHTEPVSGSGPTTTTLLAGPLYDHEYLHYEGRPVDHHGLPRFDHATFHAAYPFGQVDLTDSALPVKVRIKAFNPLIPGDAEASGLPVAVMAYEVTNTSNSALRVSVCGSMRNFVGRDGSRHTTNWKGDFIPLGAKQGRNTLRRGGGLTGIFMDSQGVDSTDTAWGNMALTTADEPGTDVTWRTTSVSDNWSNAILNFWDDFSADGSLADPGPTADDDPMASLAISRRLEPGETRTFTFFLTWHFPNRKAWSATVVGNYYTTRFADAWNAAERIVPQLPRLEHLTLRFVNALLQSSYPDVIKEAALFNLATLRSQTVFRLPSGHLMGWEGVMDRYGSCAGSCTHVWNYETATAHLFGELACTMRDVEFQYATRPDGLMNFRAALPLSEAAKGNSAAADGQMGCLMKLYREWQLSGNTELLRRHWPQARKVMAYAWAEGSWDADADGVMEGSQHNTMDVNYYGPNPQMQFWYLGALRATALMARAMGEDDFARRCDRIFRQGSAWTDSHLFNGEYYEQRIYDPHTRRPLTDSTAVPAFQLGRGCLVDQLVGQYMAHLCGLGYLADSAHIRTTLQSIMRHNFVPDFSRHFNNMRSYAMGHESGLLMASWPKGRLKVPFPYFAEVMTGFEYCAATGMLYEGLTADALRCIEAVRRRHDGARRNPFSEPECGHHYARSMASWSTLLAWSGFHRSAINGGSISFTARPGTYFWADGYNWGTCTVKPSGEVNLDVLYGQLRIRHLHIGDKTYRVRHVIKPGQPFKHS